MYLAYKINICSRYYILNNFYTVAYSIIILSYHSKIRLNVGTKIPANWRDGAPNEAGARLLDNPACVVANHRRGTEPLVQR